MGSSMFGVDLAKTTTLHSADSETWWECADISAKGAGDITFIDGTMNASQYTQILNEKMTPSLKKVGKRGIFQHDSDLKHTAKNHTRVFKEENSENYHLAKYVP